MSTTHRSLIAAGLGVLTGIFVGVLVFHGLYAVATVAFGVGVAVAAVVDVALGYHQRPRWHDLDPNCECAACEAGEPSSPYRKVRREEI